MGSSGKDVMSLDNWLVTELANRCQEETRKFRRNLAHDMRYCFELFKRAFADQSSEALAAIYRIYIGLVSHWVRRHPMFSLLELPIEYFVADSMSEFVLAMHRIPFERFASLPPILAYWRKCVHTVVMTEGRKKHVPTVAIEENQPSYKQDYAKTLESEALWARVETVLSEDKYRLLARLVYVQGLEPRKISAAYPDLWPQARNVIVDSQTMKRRLRRDLELQEMLRSGSEETLEETS